MEYESAPGVTVYGDAQEWKAPIEWTAAMEDRAFLRGLDAIASKRVRRRAWVAKKPSRQHGRVLGLTNLFLMMSLGRGCSAFKEHYEALRTSWGLRNRHEPSDFVVILW